MPYARRKTSSRRFPRKRYNKKRSLVPLIKRVISKTAEHKYFDATASDTSLINTDDTSLLAAFQYAIPQGSGQSEREGNQIFMKGVNMRALITCLSLCSMRMLLLLIDRGDNAVVGEVGTDFDYTNISLLGHLPRDVDNYKYKVIMDKTIDLDPDSKGSVTMNKYFKINKKCHWPSSTTSDDHTNRLLLFVYTNQSVVSNLSVDISSRCFFRDV